MENSFQHRSILAVVAAALSVLFAAPELYGQIRDDESSANYLATQCAVSSGETRQTTKITAANWPKR